MAEFAKGSTLDGPNLTTSQVAAFAEAAPSTPAILGWLASATGSYVYLARADGTPTLHAGQECEGEAHLVAVPGEEFSLCCIGSVDPDLLAHVALILSSSMARERAEVMVEAKSQGDLLRSLIAGEVDAVDRARSQGWDVDREVFLLLSRLDEEFVSDVAEEWRRIIRLRDPKALIVFFPTEIVAVMSKDSLDPRSFADSLPRGGGEIGVSRTGIAASELGLLYQQAELAFTIARSIGKRDGAFSLDDLGAYRLLALIDNSDALKLFLTDTLGELGVRTDLEANDLRRTLQTLLDHNLNIAETARALHFHYNTLRYRITKLEKMLGPFSTDPELRLSISLALRIYGLRSA